MGTTVVKTKSTRVQFVIPAELVGKELDITYTERKTQDSDKPRATMGEFWGILSKETGDVIQEEIKIMRDEWERNI